MKPTVELVLLVAAHNEEAALPAMHPRLLAVAEALGPGVRVLYVDDGSRDGTWALMSGFIAATPDRVGALRLSRNFGKELALTAGLDHVPPGAAVVVLDADGQDPPELVPAMVARWRAGAEVVFGRRSERHGEPLLKRATAAAFYRVINALSDTPIPRDTGDFRLIGPRAVEALRGLRERQRFMKGLFAWVGFRAEAFDYERAPRVAGASQFNYWRLWNLAIEGITGFSTVPLRVATYVGLFSALGAFAFGVWIILRTLMWGDPVAGWPSLMVVIALLGGLQLMALGIIGEYLGRLYLEAKQRPLYIIDEARLPAA
ncbi:glycosyltransferase family 2 protein [Silanimonas sp.]|jgi:glycosyltransferase involved in cell wall biosynthesis|uniref:glycosyltransferase family 2 protein n=1 Tax=Silanimonas sp. TaxID=1929290 RepID=UPI0037C89802